MDFLGIATAELADISERRIERLVNPALSEGLPAFLTSSGGINSGFMIVQYAAAALVSENKSLAHPASVDSIPSSANQEDHVSMGTIAARKAATIVENAQRVAAMELAAEAGNDRLANMVMLRGFARFPAVPHFTERYGLRAAAIAVNGMYRGVARLVGMEVLDVPGVTLADEFATLERYWPDFDFFYLHVKQTDTAGEKGDFAGKVAAIEEVDRMLPRLLALEPDVVIVGGDHSSPAVLRSHSWHPVPLMLYARHVRASGVAEFGETACSRGTLGVLPATHVMPLALAHAGRVAKYGA